MEGTDNIPLSPFLLEKNFKKGRVAGILEQVAAAKDRIRREARLVDLKA